MNPSRCGTAQLRFFVREETYGHAMVEIECAGGTDEYPELAHFFLAWVSR